MYGLSFSLILHHESFDYVQVVDDKISYSAFLHQLDVTIQMKAFDI